MTLQLAHRLDDPAALLQELRQHWRRGALVGLALPEERRALIDAVCGGAGALPWGEGPALVLGSGGSSGGRRWCLQPLQHLERSADACAAWLALLGIDPGACLHLAALPLHHISGLMPLIRAERWGAALRWLPPPWLRRGEELAQRCPLPPGRPVLLSLVPTQLQRVMESPEGLAWLQACTLIWVGGAPLGADLAASARAAGLPLAPCYGATETAAMVCALPPQRFLAGEQGCGSPLGDVQLRLEGEQGAIGLRSERLSPGAVVDGRLQPFAAEDGWWRSGDAGVWSSPGHRSGSLASRPAQGASLILRGRLDGAIHSGGETLFPEQLEERLLRQAGETGLPLEAVLLLGVADSLWGERLAALVRPEDGADPAVLLAGLRQIVAGWAAPERPQRWRLCTALAPQATGKWERARWRAWLEAHGGGEGDQPSG